MTAILPHCLTAVLSHSLLAFCLTASLPYCLLAQPTFERTVTRLAQQSTPKEHPLDMIRMSLDVKFDASKGLVKGRVTHTFKVLQKTVDSVELNAVKITILQSTVGSKPMRIRQTDTSVIVYFEPRMTWDQVDSISFTYEAYPRKGLYFIGWADTVGGRHKQIWTQGQAEDNRYWIPMYDNLNDKMITESTVTFDSLYTVISNGDKKRVTSNGDGTKTWHFEMRYPHSSYLFMLAIGKYAVDNRKSSSGVPLELYSYPERPEQVQPTYRNTEQAFDFLESTIGVPYPWGIYKEIPVEDFVFGAMENTTATIFGDFYLTDAREVLDRSYQTVNVHELTHQWFGDLVTARSSTDHWLQESFATFYPLLFTEKMDGASAYQWSLRGMQNAALDAGTRDRYPVVHQLAGGARVYQKGAAVLDMMRYVFGGEALQRVIKHYLKHHAFGNVETNDLYLSFQDTLGISPAWFFDQWLYRGGEPTFKVSTRTATIQTVKGSMKSTLVDVEQTHSTDPLVGFFAMPVVVEVHYTNNTKDSVKQWIRGERTLIEVPNTKDEEVAFVLFDPGSHILKRVDFKKSYQQLVEQVEHAPLMIDRYDALIALGEDSTLPRQMLADVLERVQKRETHFSMRAEAVKIALSKLKWEESKLTSIVERGLKDSSPDVRKTTIRELKSIPSDLKPEVEELLADPSYQAIAGALAKLIHSFPSETQSFVSRVRGIKSPGAVVELAALEGLITQGNPDAASTLARYCGPEYEFGVRRNAFQSLRRSGAASQIAFINLIDAARNPNERLANAALDTLEYFAEQTEWKDLLTSLEAYSSKSWGSERLKKLFR